VTGYRLVSEPGADHDVEATFQWYENELPGLGLEFLDELRFTYDRIVHRALKYQDLRSGVRRALFRRFPNAVYFAVGPMLLWSWPCSTQIEIRQSGRSDDANIYETWVSRRRPRAKYAWNSVRSNETSLPITGCQMSPHGFPLSRDFPETFF